MTTDENAEIGLLYDNNHKITVSTVAELMV